MLSHVNYKHYARSDPMMTRDVSNENYSNEQMRILPYPTQYTSQYGYNNNDRVEGYNNNQGSRPYLGVLPQMAYPMNY